MKTLLILLVPLLLTGRAVGAADTRLPARDEAKYKVAPKVPIKVHPFDLKDVRLLDGPFKQAMDRDAKYLLDLEPDRMLSRLHEFAGLKPKGEVYGGWEKLGLSGHILGHYLSACSMLYAASGDERFLKRVNYLVDEVALCQKAHGNGYVGGVIEGKRIFDELAAGKIETAKFRLNGGWVPWYNLHKLYAGLVHAYRFCGNQKAKEVVVGMADWAGRVTGKLSAQQMQKMFICEIGGMNEALADVYAITGKPEHLALAGRFNDRSVIDPLIRREDRLEGLHANTQVPKLIGAARQYELTGEQDLRTAAVFFWDAVTRDRSYVNGGNSDSEHFRRKGEMWKRLSPQTAETCNTYNMLKLTRHLFAWTADARYADYYERALYNHILASQDPKKGMTIYFCSLKPGHFHTYGQPFDSFWCCTGSGLENHVKYGDSIYYHDDESLYVNLLIASELTWRAKGVKIRQETKFPDKPTTRLTFRCEKPVRLALKIRHPYWANADLQAAVNGQKVDAASKPGGYLSIEGRWADGDTVDVAFPMSLRVEPMDNPKKIALLYGPIVLAGQLGREGFTEGMPYSRNHLAYMLTPTPDVPVLVTGGRPVEQWVERADGQTLQFKTNGVGRPGDVKLIPFYKAHHQRYTVYWDLQTEKQWQRTKTEREAARRRREQLRARTVDLVTPEAQSERDHKCQSEKSAAFSFHGRRCRHTEVGGWFSYEMKIAPDRPVDLRVVYWGSETGDRTFDVRIDGHNIATQTLDGQKPNEFFYRTYAIPEKLSKNKEKVTLRFESHDGHAVGRVFECRIVTRVAISSDTEARLNSLDPFYNRHVTVDGLLVASSEKVSKYARDEVAYLVRNMLVNRPDVVEKFTERNFVAVMAYNEMQTDLPECRKMSPWWNRRARGLGDKPISCGEENVLCFKGDPYRGENIFIHEFAHGIHGALGALNARFNVRLRELYGKAKETGRFRGYGMGTFGEFWAEGVQSWFHCNRGGGLEAIDANGKHICHIHTRQQLREHLPEFAELLDEAFRQNEWVYVPVLERLDQPHLRGYDPAEAPTFRWPAKEVKTPQRIEAENVEKRGREHAAKQ